MANKIIQATALPTGEQGQIIFIDNGDGTFTQTVAFDRDTYPSRAADITVGSVLRPLGFLLPHLPLPNEAGSLIKAQFNSLAAGNNDLYTCPAGKKAIIGACIVFNPTLGSISIFGRIKIGGIYYRVSGTSSVGTFAPSGSLSSQQVMVLNAGESFALNATALGLNAALKVVEIDAAIPVRTVRINALALGDNLLYTVPAAKVGVIITGALTTPGILQGGSILLTNDSGAPVTYNTYLVPSGGVVANTNLFRRNTGVANGAVDGSAAPPFLTAGDFVVVNSSSGTAGQTAFLTTYEVDA